MQHLSARVAVPFPVAPSSQLLCEIGSRLAGKRRMGRAAAAAIVTMAVGARREVARHVAAVVKDRGIRVAWARGRDARSVGHRQAFVVGRNLLARRIVKVLRDPAHLFVPTRSVGVIFQLAEDEAIVEIGQSRDEIAVAFAIQPVTVHAGTARAGVPAAQRDQFAGRLEFVGPCFAYRARPQHGEGRDYEVETCWGTWRHRARKRGSMNGGSHWLGAMTLALLSFTACAPPAETRYEGDDDMSTAGLDAIERAGCGACHAIPGISWPRGAMGPSLENFDGVGPIAGSVPNTPENLADFVRNAPAVKPGTTMPPMPLDEFESRAVASYLYGIADD